MPAYDWRKADAGAFHSFHNSWIADLVGSLNGGVLPPDYYALSEQGFSGLIPAVLTLSIPGEPPDPEPLAVSNPGGIALADAPPRIARKLIAEPDAVYRSLRRTVTVRHTSGRRIVALMEILSTANKDRAASVQDLVNKVDAALSRGIHVLLVDLFPPGKHDPRGLHGAVWSDYGAEEYEVPPAEPLTFCSYLAVTPVEAYIEHRAFGQPLPEMPLFLDAGTYVYVPLEATYQTAFRDMPAFIRRRLEQGG